MGRSSLLFISFTLTLSFLTGSLYAQQVVFEEDFESYSDDTDFINNSPWTGDLNDFTLVSENGNQLLRLNNDDASGTANRSHISTPSNTAYGSWEFYFRQDVNPTNANRSFVFLISDRENVNIFSPDESEVNGYALRLGENGDAPFTLVRVSNGNQIDLAESETLIQEGQDYQVKVTRENNGDWQLFVSE